MKEISAGGVVYKQENGRIKLLLIEDRYHKLTIPKGKQEAGETLEETAIREIEEETGIVGKIIKPLDKVYYQYTCSKRGLINKEVTYYLVEANGGNLQAQLEEINEVYWLELESAWESHKKRGYENNLHIFDQAVKHLKKG